MKRGAKRPALSDSAPDSSESVLQNHPYELWEDGVRDYVSHASHIMEKFKDVIDWLRANAAKSGISSTAVFSSDQNNSATVPENGKPNLLHDQYNGPAKQDSSASFPSLQNSGSQSSGLFSFSQKPTSTGSPSDQKSLVVVSENNKPIICPDINNGITKQATVTFFSSFQNWGSQSSGVLSFSQTPSFPGSQSSAASPKAEASGDMDEEKDLEQPSSPSLKKTEEKGIIVVHEAKCKVYVKGLLTWLRLKGANQFAASDFEAGTCGCLFGIHVSCKQCLATCGHFVAKLLARKFGWECLLF